MNTKIYFILLFTMKANSLTPTEVLTEIYTKNPEIAVAQAKARAENSLIASKYFLTNPRVGLMRESNMTAEQKQMGDMQSWTFTQEIMFPTKYFSMGLMQSSRAEAMNEEFLDKKLEVRQKALTLYYNFYAASRIAALLEAQRETLREIARIAETRRATGAVPQQDEMKAHVEQTKIENEMLLQTQEVVEVQALLTALLNRDQDTKFSLPMDDLKVPKISSIFEKTKAPDLTNSKMISAQKAWLSEASSAKTLAKMGYLPDFMISYRKPYGNNTSENAYSLSLEMSIPLWFFTKQISEVSAASAKMFEAEKQLEQIKRQTQAESKNLSNKMETLAKLLKIYETALIPQSTSALNSSRAAYSAGRVGFQELLDSERSLYSVRIEYYKNLAKYVETLTALERTLGQVISDLPMEGSL